MTASVQARDRFCVEQEWDNRSLVGVELPVVTFQKKSAEERIVTVLHPHPTYEECERLWETVSNRVSLFTRVEICVNLLPVSKSNEGDELIGRTISASEDQKIWQWMQGKIKELRQCKCPKCGPVFSAMPNIGDAQVLALHAQPAPDAPVRVRDRLCIDQEWDNRSLIELEQPVVAFQQKSDKEPNVEERIVTVLHPHPTYEECKRLWETGDSMVRVHLLTSVRICAGNLGNPLYRQVEQIREKVMGRVLSAPGDLELWQWIQGKIHELKQRECLTCRYTFTFFPEMLDAQVLTVHDRHARSFHLG